MTRPFVTLFAAMCSTAAPLISATTWTPTQWNGERAYALETPVWRAVVSIDRARLVHFGPAASATSFIYAPKTKDEPIGWGGHRVWLGPQLQWSSIWPPPDAWEKSAAPDPNASGARLEFTMPESGDGWPRLTRVYELVDGKLACRVLVAAGGKRDAQVVQIFQAPPPVSLVMRAQPSAAFPLGFALVPPTGGRKQAVAVNDLPPQAVATRGGVKLHQTDSAEKLGFAQQEIVEELNEGALHVGRGMTRGTEVGVPDAGFYTQIYLGEARTPVIELEQLSPLFKAGEAAEFTVLLDVSGK